jgi:5-methyltetrahydrofolate--homocysteine methyltransferase
MEILEQLSKLIQAGDQARVGELVPQALAGDVSPVTILDKGLIPGMDAVGEGFQSGELFIPEMLLAARAMHAALEILRPRLAEVGAKPAGKVLLGTVKGDHHDIGKDLVGIMLEGKGFEVIDIGIDVPPEKFVEAVDDEIQIVAMSALISSTMPFMQETIEALVKAGLRDRVKVMVGGGPVGQDYADSIGADAYGRDAAVAALKALELVASSPKHHEVAR